MAKARHTLAEHHGGGVAREMPTRWRKGHNHSLDALQRQLEQAFNQHKLRGKGGGGGGGGANGTQTHPNSWTCPSCNFFNFEYRQKCLQCKGDPSASGHGDRPKGKGGPARPLHGPSGKGGTSEKADWRGKAELEAKVKQLEARLEAQAKSAKLHGDGKHLEGDGEDDDPELVDDDGEGAGVQADVDNLPALQKTYDAMAAALGSDDAASKDLRARIDAARAKQRASKPTLQQVQQAQRRAGRLEKQWEASKKVKADLEEKRAEIEAQISAQDEKINSHRDELEKCRKELSCLLEKAKAEQGTAEDKQETKNKPADESSLHGAAEAWNRAKKAIELRIVSLPNGAPQEVGKQIKEKYADLEALLNLLPPSADVGTMATNGANGGGGPAGPNAAPQHDAPEHAAVGDGGPGDGTEEDDLGMLDLDSETIQRLADVFRPGDGDAASVDDGADGGGDGASNKGGAGGHTLSAKQLQAARHILGRKIPVRKPGKNRGPKA